MNTFVHVAEAPAIRLAGALISVALVLCGSQTRAEGLVGQAVSGGLRTTIGEGYSDADLALFEQAVAAEATPVRITSRPGTFGLARPRPSAAATAPATGGAEQDLFPLSGQVSPLLIAHPAAAGQAPTAPVIRRVGGALPVGVPLSTLRPLPSTR